MSFPYVFEANNETGTLTDEWDSETDTANQLDAPHYTELARFPWSTCVPYRGAYCMRAVLSGGTADAYVQEGDIDVAADTTRWFRFAIWFSPNFTGTTDDTVNVLELQQSGGTVEATIGFRYVNSDDAINIGIGETAPTSWADWNIERGVWYTVEIKVHLDDGASNDGTIDLYLTRDGTSATETVAATQVGSLDQGAVAEGIFGIQDHLATTTGTILFDEFTMDDARLYPRSRFPKAINFTKSGHAFVGPGSIESAALLTDESSNVMEVWDTDTANTNEQDGYVFYLDIFNQTSWSGALDFHHGCYVKLSGTDPRGQVIIIEGHDNHLGPLYYSVAGIRELGKG